MRRTLLLAVAALAVAAAACGDADPASAPLTSESVDAPTTTIAPTVVSGRVLAEFAADDPSVGAEAPVAIGTDILTGETVSLAVADRPLAIAFFAHWCPHCQREVAELTEWLETNELPAGVDFAAVSTFVSSDRDNYPPEAWLEGEGWTYPIIGDTEGFSVAEAFGVTSIPFWVFVNADGTVAFRVPGNLGPDELANLFAGAAG